MDRDLRRLAGPEDREKRLNRKTRSTPACIGCGLMNKANAGLALPVSSDGLKIKTDDTAAGLAFDHDDRRSQAQSVAVDHVAKSVESALHGEELLCLHPRNGRKVITRTPCKMRVSRHRNFVGMAQIQRPRIGVLRPSLNKSCAHLGNGHVQWLAAEDEKI